MDQLTMAENLGEMFAAARNVDEDFTLESHVSWDKTDAAPSADWAESWIRY